MRTCNEKDMSVSSRYPERKVNAESFPTRAKSLPPLNSNHECDIVSNDWRRIPLKESKVISSRAL